MVFRDRISSTEHRFACRLSSSRRGKGDSKPAGGIGAALSQYSSGEPKVEGHLSNRSSRKTAGSILSSQILPSQFQLERTRAASPLLFSQLHDRGFAMSPILIPPIHQGLPLDAPEHFVRQDDEGAHNSSRFVPIESGGGVVSGGNARDPNFGLHYGMVCFSCIIALRHPFAI